MVAVSHQLFLPEPSSATTIASVFVFCFVVSVASFFFLIIEFVFVTIFSTIAVSFVFFWHVNVRRCNANIVNNLKTNWFAAVCFCYIVKHYILLRMLKTHSRTLYSCIQTKVTRLKWSFFNNYSYKIAFNNCKLFDLLKI